MHRGLVQPRWRRRINSNIIFTCKQRHHVSPSWVGYEMRRLSSAHVEASNEDRDFRRIGFDKRKYPQNFRPTHTLTQFQQEWQNIEDKARIEDVTVRVAGRIRAKREASKKLVFYDLVADGSSLQVRRVHWSYFVIILFSHLKF